jgi:arsenite methyltransferase
LSKPLAADYGIDAPGVIRNLLLVAAAGLLLWGTTMAGLWSGVIAHTFGNTRVSLPLGYIAIWPAASCALMAVWMLWDSKRGKVRDRERLLDQLTWSGAERVLDLGCGRGLMLIGAAKRLTTGSATGIDIWQAEDLSGNRPEATLENAAWEGVADHVDVQTADMRDLPFPDGTFDVVVSCAAVHNLYDPADRATAIREVARVLKPGGEAMIDDIRHCAEYARHFAASGCSVRQTGSPVTAALLALLTMGSLRPGTVVAKKG